MLFCVAWVRNTLLCGCIWGGAKVPKLFSCDGFLSQHFKRYWLNLLTVPSSGSRFSSRNVSRSARCLCASCIRWDVFMTMVVSPLSTLVMIMSLFVLRLWIVHLSCVMRFGVQLTTLLWVKSCLMPSKQQLKSYCDLMGSVYLVLCFSHKVSMLA